MRITSAMQHASLIQMQTSDIYKKYMTTLNKKSKDDKKATNYNESSIKLTSNIIVQKKENTYILSKIDNNNEKTILNEVMANTKLGRAFEDYFKTNKSPELNDNLSKINSSIKTMSLVNYL